MEAGRLRPSRLRFEPGDARRLFTIYHSPFTSYGKEIIDCEGGTQTEVFGARLYTMQKMRTAARLSPEV